MQLLYSSAFFIRPNNLLLQFILPHPLFLLLFFPLLFFHASFFALAISTINLRLPLRAISFVKSLFPLKDSSLFIPSIYVVPIVLSHSVLSYLHLSIWAWRELPWEVSLLPMQSEGQWLLLPEIRLGSAALMRTGGGSHFELNKTARLKANAELNENHSK